jgi:hypothetical protein
VDIPPAERAGVEAVFIRRGGGGDNRTVQLRVAACSANVSCMYELCATSLLSTCIFLSEHIYCDYLKESVTGIVIIFSSCFAFIKHSL